MQLKTISQSAPPELRTSLGPFPPRDSLLGDVFRLRDLELAAASSASASDHHNHTKLMKTTPAQIMSLARDHLEQLKTLMKSSTKADPSLKHRIVPESNQFEAASIAIS